MALIDFHYIKTGTGELSGPSFVEQTEQAINELGGFIEEADTTADNALEAAQSAQSTANSAQQTANSAISQAQAAQSAADAAQQAADQAQATADDALEAAQDAGDTAGTKAPIMHASTATTYGVGSSSLYGHVQLSDATDGTANAATGGTAATPYAVAQSMTAAQAAQSAANSAQQVAQSAQQTANQAQTTAEQAQNTANSVQNSLNLSVENLDQKISALVNQSMFELQEEAISAEAYAGAIVKLYLESSASDSTGLPSGISYPCFFWTERSSDGNTSMMYVLSNNILYSQSGVNTTPDGATDTWTFTGWQQITYTAATTSALGVVKADGTTVEVAADGTLSINTNLLSQVYKFKGSVATVDDLPAGAARGDVYNVTSTDANYAWTGSAWDNIGGIEAVDSAPVQNSTNPVSSGGVYTALSNLQTELEGQITAATVQPSTTTPLVAGTAAVGTQTTYARGDHVHPAQVIPEYEGATSSAPGTSGLVPPAAAGEQGKFLGGDGEWHTVPEGVTLSDSVTSTSSATAASSKAVKTAYDKATSAASSASAAQSSADSAASAASVAQSTANTAKTTAAAALPKSGGTMTGPLTLKSDPTSDLQAATKQYVDKKGTSMPVGAIYVQFSGQSAPSDLFGGTWSNISNSYAGLFFRAEGGSAAAFGSNQSGGVPEISGTFKWIQNVPNSYAADGAFSLGTKISMPDANDGNTTGQEFTFSASKSNALYGAAAEVRPINSTIRIWKRTA